MRETLQALVDHADTGSRVRSLPIGPAPAAMKLSSPASASLPFAPYHWLLYGESLWFDITKAETGARAGDPPLERLDGDRVLRLVPRPPRRAGRHARARTTSRRSDSACCGCSKPCRDHGTRPVRCCSGALLLLLFAVPMAIALGSLHHPTWFPMLDLAQTDMRVRAVGTAAPAADRPPGPHRASRRPGEPPRAAELHRCCGRSTRLFGGRGWALFVSTFALHLVAIATALWLAFRRGGTTLMLAMGLVLVVLARTYGLATLSQPWNPYLPADGLAGRAPRRVVGARATTWPMLPVLVFAGSFCMQTHLPYLGLAGGLVAVVVTIVAVVTVLRRDDADRRRAAAALGAGGPRGGRARVDPAGHRRDHPLARQPHADLARPRQPATGRGRRAPGGAPAARPPQPVDHRGHQGAAYHRLERHASSPGWCSPLLWAGSVVVAWRSGCAPS